VELGQQVAVRSPGSGRQTRLNQVWSPELRLNKGKMAESLKLKREMPKRWPRPSGENCVNLKS